MANAEEYGRQNGNWLKVFTPNARCLSNEEVLNLPKEKKDLAAAAGAEGIWLEVLCPKDVCIIGQDTVAIPVMGITKREKHDLWLSLFCPEERCVATSASDLP